MRPRQDSPSVKFINMLSDIPKVYKPKFHKVMKSKVVKGLTYYRLNYNAKAFDGAACAGADTEMFYPDRVQFSREEALFYATLCSACPAKAACLEWALAHERQGVWAGTTPETRTALRKSLNIGLKDPDDYNDSELR